MAAETSDSSDKILHLEEVVKRLRTELSDQEKKWMDFSEWQRDIMLNYRDQVQRLNKLERYITERNGSSRRDSYALMQELVGYIATRVPKYVQVQHAGLDYKAVMLFLHFKHPPMAYRIMQQAAEVYPDWLKYVTASKKRMLVPTMVFSQHISETEGLIWRS